MSKIQKTGRDACSRSASLSRISDPLIRFVETSRGAAFQARPGTCLFARSMSVAAVSFANHQSDPRKDPAGPVFVFVGDTASVGSEITVFRALALRQDRPYDAALRVVRADQADVCTNHRGPLIGLAVAGP
jgi:hypothetical protein